MKRMRDEALALLNWTQLKAGRFPGRYDSLVKEIVQNLPQPSGAPGLTFYVLQALQTLLPRYGTFEPSNEARHASISTNPVTEDMASRIALAFFKSKAEAPPPVLGDFQKKQMRYAQAVIDRLSTKAELTWSDKYNRDKALSTLIALDDRLETTLDLFMAQNADLVHTFAYDAVDSFLALPESHLQPLLNASVQLVLQPVDATTYKPIADDIHMDLESDMLKDFGSRYGRPAAEQDVQSLVTSFCADLVDPGRVVLSPCSTVYFENMPVVKPALLLEAARVIKRQQGMEVFTEYEIISAMGVKLVKATSEAVSKISMEDLRIMGIVAKQTEPLEWTNVNALAFHRSASRYEVLKGAVPTSDGRVAPRLRVFAVLLTDNARGKYNVAVRDGATADIEVPARAGKNIKIEAHVTILRGGRNAGMGEDVMP